LKVDSRREAGMIERKNFSAAELLFLSITVCGMIGLVASGLQLVSRFDW
jgi:hypothetical protein